MSCWCQIARGNWRYRRLESDLRYRYLPTSKPETRNHIPSTFNPHPTPLTQHPSPLTHHPSPLNPQPSTLTPHPSPLEPHTSTPNTQPSPLNPHPSTLNTQPLPLKSHPSTLSSGSRVPGRTPCKTTHVLLETYTTTCRDIPGSRGGRGGGGVVRGFRACFALGCFSTRELVARCSRWWGT